MVRVGLFMQHVGHTRILGAAAVLCAAVVCSTPSAQADAPPETTSKPDHVQRFLRAKKGTWRDANVPYKDGKVLHDLVVKRKAKRILEIGTSTGHSTIWLAWAAKKVGGHVTTIEISRSRHAIAKRNVARAGLSSYVTFHLADAHKLTRTLPGPFDFVFSDADKGWYINYFKAIDSKLTSKGCIAAHNALNGFAGVDRYIRHVRKRSDYRTTIDRTSRSGFAISCKVR